MFVLNFQELYMCMWEWSSDQTPKENKIVWSAPCIHEIIAGIID